MKTIYFTVTDDRLLTTPELWPESMSNHTPRWFKKISANVPTLGNYGFKILNRARTVKTCPSFVDVFQEGYVIKAPQDYLFKVQADGTWMWKSPVVFKNEFAEDIQAEIHEDEQYLDHLPPGHNIKKIFKIVLPWNIHVPKGYSIRQIPMPFDFNEDWHVSYGVMKADRILQINLQLNFTSDKEEILIKQGTPLCVYIPFKREKFNIKVVKRDHKKKFVTKESQFHIRIMAKFKNSYYTSGYGKDE